MSASGGRDVSVSPAVWTPPADLLDLAREGGIEVIQQIFEDFRTDTASRLRTLGQAVQRDDSAAARREAHAIKGGAVQVGAEGIANLCNRMESPDGAAEMASLFDQLRLEFTKTAQCMVVLDWQEVLTEKRE